MTHGLKLSYNPMPCFSLLQGGMKAGRSAKRKKLEASEVDSGKEARAQGKKGRPLKLGYLPSEVPALLDMGHEVIEEKFNSVVAGHHSQVCSSSGIKHECLSPSCQCECGGTIALSSVDSNEMAGTHLTPV